MTRAAGAPDEPADRPAPLVGVPRLVRVGVLGAASLLLATGAHVAGGGSLPSPAVLVVLAAMLGLVAVTATARRARLRLLLPLLTAEQLLTHVVLAAAAGAGAGCVAAPHAAAHPASVLHCDTMGGSVMAGPGWSMWALHLVATLATGWLLSRGENALWAWAERVIRAATAHPGARPRRRRPPLPGQQPLVVPAGRDRRPGARGPPAVRLLA